MSFGGFTRYKLRVMLVPKDIHVLPKLLDEFAALQTRQFVEPDVRPLISSSVALRGRLQNITVTWMWGDEWHSRATQADIEERDGPSVTVAALRIARKWKVDSDYCPKSIIGVATSYVNSDELDQLFGYSEWEYFYDEAIDALISGEPAEYLTPKEEK